MRVKIQDMNFFTRQKKIKNLKPEKNSNLKPFIPNLIKPLTSNLKVFFMKPENFLELLFYMDWVLI